MSFRPGISDETITKLGIRRVTAPQAMVLVGLAQAGIYIPFEGVADIEGDYGRLRLDKPLSGNRKYHQRYGSKIHNYIQPGLTLKDGALILIEGEFKSISLTEAGFPSIGTSGLYSWGKKIKPVTGQLLEDRDETDILTKTDRDGVFVFHREIRQAIERLNPERIVYIGDPDTTLNLMFGDAMAKLVSLAAPRPVKLVRIPFDAPHGKGVDDIRESMGVEAFQAWFQQALNDAAIIPEGVTKFALMNLLIEREKATFPTLTGEKLEKAKDQLAKLHVGIGSSRLKEAKQLLVTVEDLVSNCFKIPASEFAAQVAVAQEKQRAKREAEDKKKAEQEQRGLASKRGTRGAGTTAPPATQGDASESALAVTSTISAPSPSSGDFFDPVETLNSFVMIGEEFLTYSYVKVGGTYKRSQMMFACSKTFVSQSLAAAGFNRKKPSTPSLPVVGEIPNLNQMQAALFHLSATRCVGTTNLLFRPYGPMVQQDGTRLFNTSLVRVMEPKDDVRKFDDLRIAGIMSWLALFFVEPDAFEHFLSLLSYVYKAARRGEPKKTRAVFFIGPTNSGKSLLIDKIVPMIFGQTTSSDAHRLILGEMGTTSILGNYVCKLSDKNLGSPTEIKRVREGILALLADHNMGGRALYEDVKTIDVINLFMFSSNPDGSVIQLLDDIGQSTLEKMAIYEGCFDLEKIKLVNEFIREKPISGKELIEEIIGSLPYFCSFLANWDGSRFADDRFGVKEYVPEKFKKPPGLAPKDEIVKELLLKQDFDGISAGAIYTAISKSEANKALLDKIDATQMRAILLRLAKLEPDLVQLVKYTKTSLFFVTATVYKLKYGISETAPSVDRTLETPAAEPVTLTD